MMCVNQLVNTNSLKKGDENNDKITKVCSLFVILQHSVEKADLSLKCSDFPYATTET